MDVGTLWGTDHLGIQTLYIDTLQGAPYILKYVDGMCGREVYKIYVHIEHGKTQVGGYTYRVQYKT